MARHLLIIDDDNSNDDNDGIDNDNNDSMEVMTLLVIDHTTMCA
jgi:hypothetical protein